MTPRLFFFNLLGASLFVASAPVSGARAAGPACEQIFADAASPVRDAARDAAVEKELHRFLFQAVDREFLKASPRFQKFARTHSPDWITQSAEKQTSLMLRYLREQVMEPYSGPKLERMRAESLSEILRMHGVKTSAGDARKTLEKLSRRNVDRILAGRNTTSLPEVAKVLEKLPKLKVFYRHDTHANNQLTLFPLLSARRLENLGIREGLNSQFLYNREFLRSDDSVFFQAMVAFSREEAMLTASGYGDQHLFLEPGYAADLGMVSLANMYPRDLKSGPHLTEPQARAFGSEPDLWGHTKMSEPPAPVSAEVLQRWERARNRLFRFDFTSRDFEGLVDRLLVAGLNQLWLENPAKFHATVEQLMRLGQDGARQRTLQELVFGVNQLNAEFELKVPVAVSTSAISSVSSVLRRNGFNRRDDWL